MKFSQFLRGLFSRKKGIANPVWYYQNGTFSIGSAPLEPMTNHFYIEIIGNSLQSTYYMGDSIIYEVEHELGVLQDSFRRILFPDDIKYYAEIKNLPILINVAGMSSDSYVSRESLEKMLKCLGNTAENNRHMYFADVVYLINSIKNLIIGLEANFIDYFRLLSETSSPCISKTGTFVVSGQHAEHVVSVLASYYIKLYSILDLLTKVAYEYEHPRTVFCKYPRLSSKSMLYDDKKCLLINEMPNTLFVKDDQITEIETIRNEVVHNGMWENNARLFITLENGTIIGRFVLYPDMVNGRFVAYGNRHHFFSEGTKVNDILPQLHLEFLTRLRNSIQAIYRRTLDE